MNSTDSPLGKQQEASGDQSMGLTCAPGGVREESLSMAGMLTPALSLRPNEPGILPLSVGSMV